jgi:hypothetical protein
MSGSIPNPPARNVCSLVCQLDLDAWLREIKAIEHHGGGDATDPRLLVALWVFATLRGVGSARELDRLARHRIERLKAVSEAKLLLVEDAPIDFNEGHHAYAPPNDRE